MTAREIIDLLILEFKTDQAGFAQMVGVHKSTISNIQNGHTRSISKNLAQKIIRLRSDISYNGLLGKDDRIFLEKNDFRKIKRNVTLNCADKQELTIPEIMQFVIDNLGEFEKEKSYQILKESIENGKKIRLLEAHLGIETKKDRKGKK